MTTKTERDKRLAQETQLAAELDRFEQVMNREFPGATATERALIAMKLARKIQERNNLASQAQVREAEEKKATERTRLEAELASKLVRLDETYKEALADLAAKPDPRYNKIMPVDRAILDGTAEPGTHPSERATRYIDDFYAVQISNLRRAITKTRADLVAMN